MCLTGDLGPFGTAEVAMRLLHSLVELQPAQGEGGRLLHPLPTVHRLLAEPTCLPHLAQVKSTCSGCMMQHGVSNLLSTHIPFMHCVQGPKDYLSHITRPQRLHAAS